MDSERKRALLMGPVTKQSLALFLSPESANGPSVAREKGALCFYPESLRPAREFYGIENNTSGFPVIGIVGRWDVVEFEGEDCFLPKPLEGEDADDFEKIIGLSPARMDEILKEKTAINPAEPLAAAT